MENQTERNELVWEKQDEWEIEWEKQDEWEVVEDYLENELAGAEEQLADHFFSNVWWLSNKSMVKLWGCLWKEFSQTITKEIEEAFNYMPLESMEMLILDIRHNTLERAKELYFDWWNEVTKDEDERV
jgi:hypothetical protein